VVGGSLEAGNAWYARNQVSLSDLRWGSSLFVGADTGIGPMYLGLTHAPRGGTGVVFLIGRP
jgi:NTE family protein